MSPPSHRRQSRPRLGMIIDQSHSTADGPQSASPTEKAMPSIFVWLRAMRIHQWSKNILLFVPLFVGHAFSVQAVARSGLGFVLLSLISSATYIINDLAGNAKWYVSTQLHQNQNPAARTRITTTARKMGHIRRARVSAAVDIFVARGFNPCGRVSCTG